MDVEAIWEDPVANFWWRLKNIQLDDILEDKSFLSSLRHEWTVVRRLANTYSDILEHRNISLEEEVIKASMAPVPEQYDDEDEQKWQTSRRFAYKDIPESSQEWDELHQHRSDCKEVSKTSLLPADLTQEIMDFRGPTEKVVVEEEPCCPDQWILPGL